LKQSLEDSSFDTWIKFYRPNENTPNSVVSYYSKGSLSALALDITLQTKTEGRVSLDDVMRQLWKVYGSQNKGLPEGEFEKICEQVSGLELKTFFDNWVRGTGDQPITTMLLGVGIKSDSRLDHADQNITAHLGCDVEMRGANIFVKIVHSGSAAERAGIAAGDELVAFDGIKINRKSLKTLYKQYRAGFKADILVFRQECLLELTIRLAEPLKQKWKLEIDDTANDRVQNLRNKWLWQEMEMSGLHNKLVLNSEKS
jgi:predicted metalloprotease with PDZ domain